MDDDEEEEFEPLFNDIETIIPTPKFSSGEYIL